MHESIKYIVFPFAAKPILYSEEIEADLRKKRVPYINITHHTNGTCTRTFNSDMQSIINKNHYFIIDDILLYFKYSQHAAINICDIKRLYNISEKDVLHYIEQKVPFDLCMFYFMFEINGITIRLNTNLCYKFRYNNDGELYIYVQDSVITSKKISQRDKDQIGLFKILEST